MLIKMNTQPSDSFTVTLQSNLCMHDYPHNTNYKFTNKLPHLINVKEFEVGLVDLYHYDLYDRPSNRDQDETIRANKNNLPFFDTILFDNEISVIRSTTSRLQVLKENDEGFLNFLARLNISLAKFNMTSHFSLLMQRGVPIQVIPEYTDPRPDMADWKLGISETLCNILGLEKFTFAYGRYEGERNIDLEMFRNLPNGDVGSITKAVYDRIDVQLPQIRGKPTLSTLVNQIIDTLDEKHCETSIIVDTLNGKLQYEIETDKRVILSKFLNNYLGLPDNFYFEGEGSINVPDNIIDPESHERFMFEALQRHTPSTKILVLVSIIGPQYFGDKEYPILAVLNRIGRSGIEIAHKINPIVYKGINVHKISEIEISLL